VPSSFSMRAAAVLSSQNELEDRRLLRLRLLRLRLRRIAPNRSATCWQPSSYRNLKKMRCASAHVESAFAMPVSSNERPLETTTIRLRRDAGMCVAPWYVGEELLREGFTDIRHVPVRAVLQQRQIIGRGDRFFSRDVRRLPGSWCSDHGSSGLTCRMFRAVRI
jgi:hypothetical protein